MSINIDAKIFEDKPAASKEESGLGFLINKWRLYLFLFLSIAAFGKFLSRGAHAEVWTQGIRNIVAAIGLFLLLVASLFNAGLPYLILLLYVPFSQVLPGRFGGGIRAFNLFNMLFFIVLASLIVAAIKGKKRFFVSNPLTKWVIVLCVLSLLNYIFSSFRYGSGYGLSYIFFLKRWLDPLLLFFVTSVLVTGRDERRDSLVTIMLGIAMFAFLSIKDVGQISHFAYKRRIVGVADQANILGAFCVDYMFIFLGIFLVNFKKKIYWLATIPFWYALKAVLFSFSRGAYLGFVAASLVISFIRDKRLFVIVVLLFLLIFNSPALFLPQSVAERISMTLDQEKVFTDGKTLEVSAALRLQLWKITFELVMRKPIFGYGFGMVGQYLGYYASRIHGDVHNTYLLVAAEHGTLWLFIFMILVFLGVKKSWYVYLHSNDDIIKGAALGFIAGTAGFLVVNMFGSHLTTLSEVAYFWVLLAIIANEEKCLRQEKTPIATGFQ